MDNLRLADGLFLTVPSDEDITDSTGVEMPQLRYRGPGRSRSRSRSPSPVSSTRSSSPGLAVGSSAVQPVVWSGRSHLRAREIASRPVSRCPSQISLHHPNPSRISVTSTAVNSSVVRVEGPDGESVAAVAQPVHHVASPLAEEAQEELSPMTTDVIEDAKYETKTM